jgi:drug/metabolite transporter (DMT)-like permease
LDILKLVSARNLSLYIISSRLKIAYYTDTVPMTAWNYGHDVIMMTVFVCIVDIPRDVACKKLQQHYFIRETYKAKVGPQMTPRNADILLVILTAAWGSSYLFMKIGIETIEPFNLVALRFGLAFVIVALIFPKRVLFAGRRTIGRGAILGFILFLTISAVMYALYTMTTSGAGFLAGSTVVFVLLMQMAIRRRWPSFPIVIGAAMTFVGIAMLTMNESFGISVGSMLCLFATFVYAIQIVLVERYSVDSDPMTLGILEVGFAGAFGLLFAILFESPVLPSTQEGWTAVIMLAVFASALGFTLQPVAQKYTTAERTGIIFSMEPLFVALFGFMFLDEVLGVPEYIGAVLILVGVLVSGLHRRSKRDKGHRVDLPKQ